MRYAGAQGFLTNLGGLATMTYLVPANITGLALVQCRMVAGIAHLRGYDLTDPRVRNAVLVSMLGEEAVQRLVERAEAPGAPDGAGHRAGPRPGPRPGDLGGGRRRPGRQGGRQAGRGLGRPAGSRSSAAWSAPGPTAS